MRTNAERNNVESADVYAGLSTSYSSTYLKQDDAQEFSLESVQEKLGKFSETEEAATVESVLNADVMPSSQTLTMNFQREYENSDTTTSKKLDARTKVAIVGYVAIVLALVLGITLVSVSVSDLLAENIALTESYQETLGTIATLNEELSAEDVAVLTEKAAELGYVEASNADTQMYTKVETRPAQNFEIESNWFDSLCDWLSSIFGD